MHTPASTHACVPFQVNKLQLHNAYLEQVLRHERSRGAAQEPPAPADMMREAAASVAACQLAHPIHARKARAMADRFEALKQLNSQASAGTSLNNNARRVLPSVCMLHASVHCPRARLP